MEAASGAPFSREAQESGERGAGGMRRLSLADLQGWKAFPRGKMPMLAAAQAMADRLHELEQAIDWTAGVAAGNAARLTHAHW